MIATLPPLADAAGSSFEVAGLGSGRDLDPPRIRWIPFGGIAGFLVWAIALPKAAPFHGFLHQRGPTQVICMIAAGMLVAFLITKWRLLKREQAAFARVDFSVAGMIRSGDLVALRSRLDGTASILSRRLRHLLAIWESTGSPFQLERVADADADRFELAMQASYALAKVLLWAIPILGFIGTVIGMSQAVGSFDQVLGNTDNVDGLKTGLTKVTTGLGTAFDTTYLALVISVVLTIPLNSCERLEESLLSQVDDQVRTAVIALSPNTEPSLSQSSASTNPFDLIANSRQAARDDDALQQATGLSSAELGELISDAFERHLPDPSVLVQPAQVYAETLTQAALDKLEPLTRLVRDSVEGVAEARLSLQDQAELIRASMDGISLELNHSIQSIRPLLQRLNSIAAGSLPDLERQQQYQALLQLRQSIETLSQQIEHLSLLPPRDPWWRRLVSSLRRLFRAQS